MPSKKLYVVLKGGAAVRDGVELTSAKVGKIEAATLVELHGGGGGVATVPVASPARIRFRHPYAVTADFVLRHQIEFNDGGIEAQWKVVLQERDGMFRSQGSERTPDGAIASQTDANTDAMPTHVLPI